MAEPGAVGTPGAGLGRGCLLVASPGLADPNFVRSVVLVIQHDAQGSYGLVLNRPLRRTLDELLEVVPAGAERVPVCEGGPVQPGAVQLLARSGSLGQTLLDGVSVGADLPALLGAGVDVRAYLGYAGWGAGQLHDELAEGSWIVAPARAEHVFDIAAEELWGAVLRQLGGRYAWLALGGEPESN